jgi:hypothetical protein
MEVLLHRNFLIYTLRSAARLSARAVSEGGFEPFGPAVNGGADGPRGVASPFTKWIGPSAPVRRAGS